MVQIKIILNRLRKPSVIISIIAQIATVVSMFNINSNLNIITGVIIGICSILVLLGIVSNPATKNLGYGDNILECSNEHKPCEHVEINGKMICLKCGCEYKSED